MADYDDLGDEEWIDDEDGDSEDPLLKCPSCKQPVHEDTQQCPYCGDWITPVDEEPVFKRLIWIVAALLLVISMVLYSVL